MSQAQSATAPFQAQLEQLINRVDHMESRTARIAEVLLDGPRPTQAANGVDARTPGPVRPVGHQLNILTERLGKVGDELDRIATTIGG